MRYTIRPLSDRTVFSGKRQPNPFRAKWTDTLEQLDTELTLLQAKDVVFEIDVREGDIRLDGMLRANAKVDFPGVRIAFDSKYGPLTYATDRFEGRYYGDPPDWQINVRAIALSLEALRKVDRYGVTKRGEQYAGWKQLPAGTAMAASHMTATEACVLFSELSGVTVTPGESEQSLRARLRSARARAHPDRNDGDRTLWDQVEQAATVLGLS